MPEIAIDDISVHVQIAGSGTPLVLLHGSFMNSLSFERQLEGLGQEFQVIVPDLRGHGGTSCPVTARSFDRPRDVIGILDEMGVPQAFVGGHSMGGPIAIQVALDYPDRCLGLVLLATGPGPADRPLRATPQQRREAEERAQRLLDLGVTKYFYSTGDADAPGVREFLAQPSYRRLFDAILERNNPVWLANSLRLAGTDVPPELAGHLTSRRRARLSEISLPVLFLVGGEDPVFLPAADLIGAEMPHSQVDIIQRATHMLIIDAADEVNRKTTEFIRQHEGEQRSCWSP